MAQQTRIAAVLPYYERWMQLFPTVKSLAEALEDRVLKAWEGLGYYARARNLQKAARVLMAEWNGEMPGDSKSLEGLPGVGPYTAAAIASIAYGEKAAAVDGNALRVVSRIYAITLPVDSREGREKIRSLQMEMLTDDRPGDGNQAIMDLGSSHCLPKQPRCQGCPLETCCAAHAAGWEAELPVKAAKKEQRLEHRAVALLADEEGRYLLRKRDEGLLRGLWEFPGETLENGRSAPVWAELKKLGLQPGAWGKGPKGEHVFTHIRWKMQGYWLQGKGVDLPEGYAWARSEDMEDYAIPAAMRIFFHAVQAKRRL